MNQIEAVQELARLGIMHWPQVENFTCGSEHESEKARKVLALAEIAFPGRIATKTDQRSS